MSKDTPFPHNPVVDIDLMRFVDGVIDEDRNSDVIAHLAADKADTERVHSYLRQSTNLRALRDSLDLGPDERFHAELQQALVSRMSRQRFVRQFVATAAAVALLVSTAIAGHWAWRSMPADMDQIVARAEAKLENPTFFPFGPVFDLSERAIVNVTENQIVQDQLDDVTWLAKHLARNSLTRPRLDGLGLQYLGSQRLAYTDAPAIRLRYVDPNGLPILVFVAVLESDVKSASSLAPEGYLALQWRLGQLVFALVAPPDIPQLIEISNMVSGAVASLPEPVGTVGETAKASLSTGTGVARDVFLPDAASEVDPAIAVQQSPIEPQIGEMETQPITPGLPDENEPESL